MLLHLVRLPGAMNTALSCKTLSAVFVLTLEATVTLLVGLRGHFTDAAPEAPRDWLAG